jgi:Na+/H+ antiporter NhaC
MTIGIHQRVRLAAVLFAVAVTALLFFGFPFLGNHLTGWFAAWFDQLSSQQQHVVVSIGHSVSYVLPVLWVPILVLGIFLRARRNRPGRQANSEA